VSDQINITPMIRHRLLMDILPFELVHKFWEMQALVPPSPDVRQAMEAESTVRMAQVAPLAPVCEMYITLTSEIITEAMYQNLLTRIDGEDIMAQDQAREMLPGMTQQNREVVRAALYATLAHLIDGGFVTIANLPRASLPGWP
jgi:hypothetical protein